LKKIAKPKRRQNVSIKIKFILKREMKRRKKRDYE